MATKVVLMERVEKLGNMGDIVSVRPGFARNYLLPQKKALRATKENLAYYEAQKQHLQAENEKRKKDAEKLVKKIEGTKVPMIRQASESGQLFGSVTARDIAAELSSVSGEKIDRSMVYLNQNFKMIGLFPVHVYLHPEVSAEITVNIARSQEEAKIQAETGRALIAEDAGRAEAEAAAEDESDAQLEGVLEDGALEAEKEKKASKKAEAEEKAEKAKAKPKKKAKAAADAADEGASEAEDGSDEE